MKIKLDDAYKALGTESVSSYCCNNIYFQMYKS